MDLEVRLANSTWLFGPVPGLADMAILPFVRQFAHTDVDWFAAQSWPHLARWLADWESSALLAQVMAKYPAWHAGLVRVEFPARPE